MNVVLRIDAERDCTNAQPARCTKDHPCTPCEVERAQEFSPASLNIKDDTQIWKRCVSCSPQNKGECNFIYNNGSYCLPLKNEISILLYNPIDPLPVDVRIDPETRLISLLISIEKLHGLFSKDSETIPFLSENNINKKFYKDKPLSPSMLAILNQLLNEKIGSNVKSLYLKGKIFELLSVYFNSSTNLDIDLCPFLSDDNNVKKIKKAKYFDMEISFI